MARGRSPIWSSPSSSREYVAEMGFTHVEMMPVAEHPFAGSWGYQVSGYYAPTSRFGTPDEFRVLVDALHQRGIGVILDWVPAHFPRDEFALARFDGTALYEHADPRQGEHPDWGTLVFNFGRNEVRNFLVANALYWIEQFHSTVCASTRWRRCCTSTTPGRQASGCRTASADARTWTPSAFSKRSTRWSSAAIRARPSSPRSPPPGPACPGPRIWAASGFGFKWNMGWMHDTLDYFQHDPVHRRFHHGELTFGLLYAWTENFILPLSHDEVVHGKSSLLNKMPGDRWQQLANLRALYAWMWAHPGKQLLFMGGELGQEREWSHERQLDWWILDDWADHRRLQQMVQALNQVYRRLPALWEDDVDPAGFAWIDANDADQSVLSFLRQRAAGTVDDTVACVANLTPVVRARLSGGPAGPGPVAGGPQY